MARDLRYLTLQEGIDALIEEFLQHPECLLEHAQSWGKLLQSAASRRVPELKSAIRAACSGPVARDMLLVGQPSTFALDLPQDAPLLPHLVNVLTEACVPRYSFDDFHMASGRSRIEAGILEKLRMWVSQFVPDRSCLEQVSAAGQHSKDVRAAAIILYCLHPSASGPTRLSYYQSLTKFYSREIGRWYLPAAWLCLEHLLSSKDPLAANTIGELFDLARDDYEARSRLDPLLEAWRQTSRAPVRTTGQMELWSMHEI